MGFLSDHVADVRRQLKAAPLDDGALYERAQLQPPPRDFAGALRGDSPAFIAEVKRASPSEGAINAADPVAQAARYEAAGAAAISVLTEPKHFDGSLADLTSVRRTVGLPVLRKDFLVHPSQLLEARANGADAALLIAGTVSRDELVALVAAARDLGIEPLVEATNEEELADALATDATVIGVNARNLETLEVDVDRALWLIRQIPDGHIRVFESGISRRDQVEAAVAAGADAILVGTALMKAADPGEKLRELLGVSV